MREASIRAHRRRASSHHQRLPSLLIWGAWDHASNTAIGKVSIGFSSNLQCRPRPSKLSWRNMYSPLNKLGYIESVSASKLDLNLIWRTKGVQWGCWCVSVCHFSVLPPCFPSGSFGWESQHKSRRDWMITRGERMKDKREPRDVGAWQRACKGVFGRVCRCLCLG